MNRLKFLREEKGIFQKDIANYLNCSIAIISMYEKGQRVMDVNIAQKLSEYFNVSRKKRTRLTRPCKNRI